MKKLLILLIFISNYSILLQSASSSSSKRVIYKAIRTKGTSLPTSTSSSSSTTSAPSISSSSSTYVPIILTKLTSLSIDNPYERYKKKCEARRTKEKESLKTHLPHLPTGLQTIITKYSVDCVAPEQFKKNGELLAQATEANDIKKVKELLESEAVDVNVRAKFKTLEDENLTPLHFAAWEGYTDIVKLLLEHNADVNARSDWEMTPLMEASMGGNVEIVDLLLKNKAKVNLEDDNERTALSLALDMGYEDESEQPLIGIVRLLLEYDAPVDDVISVIEDEQFKYRNQLIKLLKTKGIAVGS